MATHSSILTWKILWTEEPGGGYSSCGLKESNTDEWLSIHGESLGSRGIHFTGDFSMSPTFKPMFLSIFNLYPSCTILICTFVSSSSQCLSFKIF